MSTRTILVANTNTQKKLKFENVEGVETFADLKNFFNRNEIDYTDMDITEGLSKTTFLSDDAILPTHTLYKGNYTDDLVILITKTRKKIDSGAGYERAALYALIKEWGLQEDVRNAFGRNMTQVSSADLQEFLDQHAENECPNNYDEDEDDEWDDDDYADDDDCAVNNTQEPDELERAVMGVSSAIDILKNVQELLSTYRNKLEDISFRIGNTDVTSEDIKDMIDSMRL